MNITHDTLLIKNDPTPWVIAQPNKDTRFCVLWLQGWGSTIKGHLDNITRLAAHTNLSFAMLDYGGHGTHPIALENTTRAMQFNEVCAAYDQLKALGYEHIIVIGGSFGSYMAALLAGERNPYGVILRVPAIYDDAEFAMPYAKRSGRDAAYQKLKTTISPTSNLKALTSLASYNGTVYIIEHELDEVIPKNIPHSYFEVVKHGNYLVVPGAAHSPMTVDEHDKCYYAYIEQLIVSLVRLIVLE